MKLVFNHEFIKAIGMDDLDILKAISRKCWLQRDRIEKEIGESIFEFDYTVINPYELEYSYEHNFETGVARFAVGRPGSKTPMVVRQDTVNMGSTAHVAGLWRTRPNIIKTGVARDLIDFICDIVKEYYAAKVDLLEHERLRARKKDLVAYLKKDS